MCARVCMCAHTLLWQCQALEGGGGGEREMLKIERKADEREVLREVRGKK